MAKEPKDPILYIEHILQAISRIRSYTRGVTVQEFLKDRKTQDAVLLQFEIIGEASNRFTKDVRAMAPHVPWRDIIDMRNKLIHDYFDVDIVTIWDTTKKDLPDFERAMKQLRKELVRRTK